MSANTSARAEILSRIRTALPGAPADIAQSYASTPRLYERAGKLGEHDCIELLIDRLKDYDSEVIELADSSAIAQTVDDVLRRNAESRVLLTAAFPQEWRPRHAEVVVDDSLSVAALEACPTVLTSCEVAVASTGTIVLVHEGAQGRRAITLVPDHHIVLLRRDQVVELLPEALSRIAAKTKLPITTISGPSATSDIEMTRIRGVHGPRRLTVILYS